MSVTNLGQSVGLLEGEDGGDRADDHDQDGGQEHGVQHAVLGRDARHPPVADLKRDISILSFIWTKISTCKIKFGYLINLRTRTSFMAFDF